jgi:hypothetical protein
MGESDRAAPLSPNRRLTARLGFLVSIIVALGIDAHRVLVSKPNDTKAKIGVSLNAISVLIACGAVNIETLCLASSYFGSFLFRINAIYGSSHNQALYVSQRAFATSGDIRQRESKIAWQRKVQDIDVRSKTYLYPGV